MRHCPAIVSDVEVEGRLWRAGIHRGGKALRLRGSTACVCLGAVWAAGAELPHLPAASLCWAKCAGARRI